MTDATDALWQALTALDPVKVGTALRQGADVTQANAHQQTPLEYVVLTPPTLTLLGELNETVVNRHRHTIERLLLNAGAPLPLLANSGGLLANALASRAFDFHDSANVSQVTDGLHHMTLWLTHYRQRGPQIAGQWQAEAASAWGDFVNLFGQDSEGQAVPLAMALAEPMLTLLHDQGVPYQALSATSTPNFDKDRHFPALAGAALAEQRTAQTPALSTSAARRRRRS